MKKLLTFILMITLVLCLAACGDQQTQEQGDKKTETTVDKTKKSDSKYVVELKDAQLLTNYEGEKVFAVFYTFTNNSEDTISATAALHVQGFQDGVQLSSGYLAENDYPAEKAACVDAEWKDVRPGATIECCQGFILDSTSEVEVEVTELFSFNNEVIASKTYSVPQ